MLFLDHDTAQGPLHAGFHLDGLGGEEVALFGVNTLDNPRIDAVEDLGLQLPDVSLARRPDGGPTFVQDDTPTPEAPND